MGCSVVHGLIGRGAGHDTAFSCNMLCVLWCDAHLDSVSFSVSAPVLYVCYPKVTTLDITLNQVYLYPLWSPFHIIFRVRCQDGNIA